MPLSSEQHENRLSTVAASEIPAILGLHPHQSPLDVWLRKVGKAGPDSESDRIRWENHRIRWGNLLEPVIRDDYAQRAQRDGLVVDQVGTLYREVRIAVAPPADSGIVTVAVTPDGAVGPRPGVYERGLEIKTHSVYAADYGRPGTDEVPHHVMIQCQIGAHVLGVPRWDLVAFYDGLPHDFVITYDRELAEAAINAAARWWREHVVAHKMPTPDGSNASERAIRSMYPGHHRDIKAARWLDPVATGHMGAIEQLRAARATAAAAKRTFQAVRQYLELAIGDHDGFEWTRDGRKERLSWRKPKDSTTVDYRAALVDWRNRLELAASFDGLPSESNALMRQTIEAGPDLAAYTTTKVNARRFTPPRAWSKDVAGVEDDEDGGES